MSLFSSPDFFSKTDKFVFDFLSSFANKSVVTDGLIIFFAEYAVYILFAVIFFSIIKFERGSWKTGIFYVCGFILAFIISREIIVETVRFLYHRPRPFSVLEIEPLLTNSGYAFPSGHASTLFALSFFALSLNRNWGLAFLGFSLLNGIARVMAGLHWPSDILGGIAVGAFSALTVHLLTKNHRPERLCKSR